MTRLKLIVMAFFFLGASAFLLSSIWAFTHSEEIWSGRVVYPYAHYGFAFVFCCIAFLAAWITVMQSPDKI